MHNSVKFFFLRIICSHGLFLQKQNTSRMEESPYIVLFRHVGETISLIWGTKKTPDSSTLLPDVLVMSALSPLRDFGGPGELWFTFI